MIFFFFFFFFERTFQGKGSPYLAYNDRKAFWFRTADKYYAWYCQNVCMR